MTLAANFAEQASVGYLVESSQPASSFQDSPAHPGFAELVDRETRSSKHLMLGEPHLDAMTDRTFALLADSPEAFEKAAGNGVKHLVLELPQSHQGKVDDFMSGKISRDEMKAYLRDAPFSSIQADGGDEALQARRRELMAENITRTFENARDAGMKVHCVDTSSDRFLNEALNPMLPSFAPYREAYLAEHPEDSALLAAKDGGAMTRFTEYFIEKTDALPEDERERLLETARKEFDDHIFASRVSRFEADLEIYGLIRERIPPNEGMIGVFGTAHLENQVDFRAERSVRGVDDLLEEEGASVTTIGLRSRGSDATLAETNREFSYVPIDPVDYTIYLDDGVMLDRGKNPIGTLESGMHSDALDQMYSPGASQPIVQGQTPK